MAQLPNGEMWSHIDIPIYYVIDESDTVWRRDSSVTLPNGKWPKWCQTSLSPQYIRTCDLFFNVSHPNFKY